MFVAFCDHVVGNSTPRCSKALPPSLKFGMTASRVCHSTRSNGWTPSSVKYRLSVSPLDLASRSRSFVATDGPFRSYPAEGRDRRPMELHREDSSSWRG